MPTTKLQQRRKYVISTWSDKLTNVTEQKVQQQICVQGNSTQDKNGSTRE